MAVEFKSPVGTRTRPISVRFDNLTLTLLDKVAQDYGLTRVELLRRGAAELVQRLTHEEHAAP